MAGCLLGSSLLRLLRRLIKSDDIKSTDLGEEEPLGKSVAVFGLAFLELFNTCCTV